MPYRDFTGMEQLKTVSINIKFTKIFQSFYNVGKSINFSILSLYSAVKIYRLFITIIDIHI